MSTDNHSKDRKRTADLLVSYQRRVKGILTFAERRAADSADPEVRRLWNEIADHGYAAHRELRAMVRAVWDLSSRERELRDAERLVKADG